MKAALKPYTNPTIEQGELVTATDVKELRDNVVKLLQDFHAHIGTTVNDLGTDNDNTKRQHGVASATTAGFAPYTIYDTLDSYEENVEALKNAAKYSLYPELAIVLWAGDYNDQLPKGWAFCDGQSVIYTDPSTGKQYKAPDLRYVEPVSVSPNRTFMSKHVGHSRSKVSTPTVTTQGEGMTKYYIIKKPVVQVAKQTVTLTVTQPKDARLATNFTTSDPDILDILPDGFSFSVDVPLGSEVIVANYSGNAYKIDKVYIKEESKASKETLTKNSFRILENTEVTADVVLQQFTFTIKGTSNQTITVVCGRA